MIAVRIRDDSSRKTVNYRKHNKDNNAM